MEPEDVEYGRCSLWLTVYVCFFFLYIFRLFLQTQYVYLKQMTKAAVVIQNQFRSYYEHKRFKKNLEVPAVPSTSTASSSAAVSTTTTTSSSASGSMASATTAAAAAANYRNYRENSICSSGRQSREGTPTSSALKSVAAISLNFVHRLAGCDL